MLSHQILLIQLLLVNNSNIIISDDPSNTINFISSILNFATEDTNLYLLLYYYMQIHLNNFYKIEKVQFSINNNLYNIDYNKDLLSIYNDLEVN